MTLRIASTLGNIVISDEVISDIVGLAAIECAGVVGMASQKRIKDGVAELLKRENYSRGIVVRNVEDEIHIDLHLVVLFGIKIAEIATTVQKKVKYSLEEILGLDVGTINIIVEDIKVDNK